MGTCSETNHMGKSSPLVRPINPWIGEKYKIMNLSWLKTAAYSLILNKSILLQNTNVVYIDFSPINTCNIHVPILCAEDDLVDYLHIKDNAVMAPKVDKIIL